LKTYSDIALVARELHAAEAAPTRQWTLPLICDHLARAMTGSTGVLGPGQSPTPRLMQAVGRVLVLKFGFIPSGRKSPQRVMPQADVTWEAAIKNLDEAIALCREKMQGDQPWLVHPMLGFSDARRWERFHIVHAKHHFGCLRVPPR
jgi:hypothetical protein